MNLLERVSAWIHPSVKPVVPEDQGEMPEEIREIETVLRAVKDPELGLDLVSLGLIRSISVTGVHVVVRMTLTTRGCPVIPLIVGQVKDAVRALGMEADVQLEWDPPWSAADMSPEARAQLGR